MVFDASCAEIQVLIGVVFDNRQIDCQVDEPALISEFEWCRMAFDTWHVQGREAPGRPSARRTGAFLAPGHAGGTPSCSRQQTHGTSFLQRARSPARFPAPVGDVTRFERHICAAIASRSTVIGVSCRLSNFNICQHLFFCSSRGNSRGSIRGPAPPVLSGANVMRLMVCIVALFASKNPEET